MNWLKKIAVALLALVSLTVLALLLARQRPSAGLMEITIEINRPAAQIWPWLNEPDKIKQWVSWTKEIRPVHPGKDGVGARDVWVMEDRNNNNALMETEALSTVYQPYRRLAAQLHSKDAFRGEITYDLTEQNGKTTLRSVGHYQYLHWLANLLEPLITPEARKKGVSDLATLKRLVEAAPTSAPSSSLPAPDPSTPSR